MDVIRCHWILYREASRPLQRNALTCMAMRGRYVTPFMRLRLVNAISSIFVNICNFKRRVPDAFTFQWASIEPRPYAIYLEFVFSPTCSPIVHFLRNRVPLLQVRACDPATGHLPAYCAFFSGNPAVNLDIYTSSHSLIFRLWLSRDAAYVAYSSEVCTHQLAYLSSISLFPTITNFCFPYKWL